MRFRSPAITFSGVTLAALCALLLASGTVNAALSATELAKLAQNPVGNLISVPFQNNANLNYGPEEKTQNVLNIQPVYPVHVNPDWNIITRTILPVITLPELFPRDNTTTGLGDVQFSAFLSPANPKGLIWGVGAIAQAPTHTDPELGNDRWGLGPTAVVLRLSKGSPWVYGALVNNVWSVSDDNTSPSINMMLLQPFLNYNLPGGFYLTSSPIITADWEADSKDTWTVPLGGGVGKIFRFGPLPVNTQLAAYYNVESPSYGADWQIRLQVQFMFPK